MRVLVATRERQGDDEYDFCWCDEGELVYPVEACRELYCSCGRAFIGAQTERATSTAKVVDRRDLDRDGCVAIIQRMLDGHGHPHHPDEAEMYVDAMRAVVARAYLGAVVERHGSLFRPRPTSRPRDVLQ